MSTALKRNLGTSLNDVAIARATDAIAKQSRALPCHVVSVSGAIITVAFDVTTSYNLPNVTIPLFGPEYIRYPIKHGDLGVVVPMDVSIAKQSGLGTDVPTDSGITNLSSLVFLPIANTAWSAVDPTSVTVYGPGGVVLRDSGSGSVFTLTPTSIVMTGPSTIQATCGGTTMSLTPSGWSISGANSSFSDGAHSTSVSGMNAAWSALVTWLNTHVHVVPQGGNTGAPTSPFSGSNIAP